MVKVDLKAKPYNLSDSDINWVTRNDRLYVH